MEKPQAPPRPATDVPPSPESPDPIGNAPRPHTDPDATRDLPDMDRPPRARPSDQTGFDRGVAEEERQRRDGTVPQR